MKNYSTNINCQSCINAVTPTLNQLLGENNWKVDTSDPNKTLTINTEHDENQLKEKLDNIGFQITF